MPAPSSSLATLRPDLGGSFEEFDLEMNRMGMIAQRIFPVFDTPKQAGAFGIIPIEQLLQNPETKRAPGGGYNRTQWKFEPSSYATVENGIEEPVDDREATLYRDYFEAEQVATARAREFVLQAAEQRIAAKLFPGAFTPTAVTNEWDDWANATPINDVEASVQRVYAASGRWPNALIITRKVFRNLRNCAQVIDRLKYNGLTDVKNVSAQALAQVFDLEEILIGDVTKNSANAGQAATPVPTWSQEYAMTARVARTKDIRECCLGRTFHWAEDDSEVNGYVETYRDETVRSEIVRVRHDVDEKLLYAAVADLMSNITT